MPLQPDGLTFVISPEVERTRVNYKNRYGITIAADLYTAKDLDRTARHAAVVIGPSHGGVKEQMPGVWANELAQRGYVALAFDPSYKGDSSGEPRFVSSPEIFMEDFSAGVDYLGTLEYVSRERIGVVGICGSGGFSLGAARIDSRIKAVVTASMYDIGENYRNGWQHGWSDADRRAERDRLAAQRWADLDSGEAAYDPVFPEEVPPADVELDPITSEFFDYYVKSNDRGYHPHSQGGHVAVSHLGYLGYGGLRYLEDIAPRPVLMLVGELAFSRWFTEEAKEQIGDSASIVEVPGARHIDLYDRVDLIPFDAVDAFLAQNLA
ncbi:hypothetical protein SAMN05216355_101470 [Actinomyces ruminicola]|uniref:Dienelactone hydrolase domain-containing protein n=1 Tax=Actinomyces ruminicola TaxID=332524 RepID=A0A1G9ZYR0_9ACTO|nr:alpha/beta hydrolase [Actinomyces ruminicola]SDN26224.1 hypothetical protein SAMN05216355_101470 [Actinomyces ruminicola]